MLAEFSGVSSIKMNRMGNGTSITFGMITAGESRAKATMGLSNDLSAPTRAMVPSVPSSILFIMLSGRLAEAIFCKSEKDGGFGNPFSVSPYNQKIFLFHLLAFYSLNNLLSKTNCDLCLSLSVKLNDEFRFVR